MNQYANFALAAASLGLSSVMVKPQRGLYDLKNPNGSKFKQDNNFIIPQVVVSERAHDRSQITTHPVEQGAAITDHAIRLPVEVTVMIGWSNSPTQTSAESLALTAASFLAAESSLALTAANAIGGIYGLSTVAQSMMSGSGSDQLMAIYKEMQNLKDSFVLFTLYTGKRVYRNMLIKSMSNDTDFRTENSLPIVIDCQEVILVNTQTAVIRADGQVSPEDTAPVEQGGVNTLTSYPNPPSTVTSTLIGP